MEKIEVLTRTVKGTIFKGVTPWILSKNRTFSYRNFSQKLCQNRSFLDILSRNKSFWDQKIEVLKRTKKWNFPKGVSPWILFKNRTFSYRCFSQKLSEKRSFLDIFNRKQSFWDHKIKFKQGPKNGHFFKELVHGFCPKIELFLIAIFPRNYVRTDHFWIF